MYNQRQSRYLDTLNKPLQLESQNTLVSEKDGEKSTTKKRKVVVLTNKTKLVVSELGCAAIKGAVE